MLPNAAKLQQSNESIGLARVPVYTAVTVTTGLDNAVEARGVIKIQVERACSATDSCGPGGQVAAGRSNIPEQGFGRTKAAPTPGNVKILSNRENHAVFQENSL